MMCAFFEGPTVTLLDRMILQFGLRPVNREGPFQGAIKCIATTGELLIFYV